MAGSKALRTPRGRILPCPRLLGQDGLTGHEALKDAVGTQKGRVEVQAQSEDWAWDVLEDVSGTFSCGISHDQGVAPASFQNGLGVVNCSPGSPAVTRSVGPGMLGWQGQNPEQTGLEACGLVAEGI